MKLGRMIDAAIAPFAPKLAARRMSDRIRYNQLATYEAAKIDRTNRDYRPKNGSADAAVIPDLRITTDRARQMVRDNADAASAVGAFGRNVVGKDIVCKPAATDAEGKPLAALNRQIDHQFYDWSSNPRVCDIEQKKTFADIKRMAVEQCVEAGQFFVLMRYLPGRGMALQCMETEQLDTMRLRNPDTGYEIRNGIEIDAYGAAVAYWFYDRPLNDYQTGISSITTQSRRVDARQVCHIMRQKRPRQTHGMTWFHAALPKMRNLGEYDAAQLEAAWLEACIALIITKDTVDDLSGGATPSGETPTDTDGNRLGNFQRNMVFEGKQGESVQGMAPTRPGGQYLPFTIAQKRAIAASLGLDYETIARDYSNGSYSSLRQALLESRREYEIIQEMIITQLCQRVYAEWVYWAMVEGEIGISMAEFFAARTRFTYAAWRAPKWSWIDPLKEILAIEKALGLRLGSISQSLAEMNLDRDEVFNEIESDRVAASIRGITLTDGTGRDERAQQLDTYGVAARAGVITPNAADESHFREVLGLPEMPAEVVTAWDEADGVRKPVTIQQDEQPAAQPGKAITDQITQQAIAEAVAS